MLYLQPPLYIIFKKTDTYDRLSLRNLSSLVLHEIYLFTIYKFFQIYFQLDCNINRITIHDKSKPYNLITQGGLD